MLMYYNYFLKTNDLLLKSTLPDCIWSANNVNVQAFFFLAEVNLQLGRCSTCKTLGESSGHTAVVCQCLRGTESRQNHRITESQNSRGWKGPLWVI